MYHTFHDNKSLTLKEEFTNGVVEELQQQYVNINLSTQYAQTMIENFEVLDLNSKYKILGRYWAAEVISYLTDDVDLKFEEFFAEFRDKYHFCGYF